MALIDLSGRWTGVYFYPLHAAFNPDDDLPPTPFTAELTDIAGQVSGTTIEPDVLGAAGAADIPAVLEGHHAGGILTFSKFPEGGGHDDPIAYAGTISEDGNNINGDWTIPGDWSGTFRMQRRVAPIAARQSASTSA